MERVRCWGDLRAGDVGFYAGEGWVSRQIRRLTRREDLGDDPVPSHAFLVISRSEVIEALEKTKVRGLSFYQEDFVAGRAWAYRPAGSDLAKREAVRLMVDRYNGAAYGWLQILGFLPVLAIRRRWNHDAPNPAPLGKICSEDVLLFLRILRGVLRRLTEDQAARLVSWSLALDPNTTDPALLCRCCQIDGVPEDLDGRP